jgi:hypothetical protein
MHKNTFLPTPEVKKIIYKGLDSGSLEIHQNTFFTTPDVKKQFLRTCIWVCGNASKQVFNHSRGEINNF